MATQASQTTVTITGNFTEGPDQRLTPLPPTNKIAEYPVPSAFVLHESPPSLPLILGISVSVVVGALITVVFAIFSLKRHQGTQKLYKRWHDDRGLEYDEANIKLFAPVKQLASRLRPKANPSASKVTKVPPSQTQVTRPAGPEVARGIILKGTFTPSSGQNVSTPDGHTFQKSGLLAALYTKTPDSGSRWTSAFTRLSMSSRSGIGLHFTRDQTEHITIVSDILLNSSSSTAGSFADTSAYYSTTPATVTMNGTRQTVWYSLKPEQTVAGNSEVDAALPNRLFENARRALSNGPVQFELRVLEQDPSSGAGETGHLLGIVTITGLAPRDRSLPTEEYLSFPMEMFQDGTWIDVTGRVRCELCWAPNK